MMGLCCFFFFFSSTLFMCGDSYPHPSSSPTAPSGLSCCCNVVVVVYHWTFDANLCFALALCPLLVVVHILSVLPSSLSLLSLSVPPTIVLVWPVTIYFTLFFLNNYFWPSLPFFISLPLLPLLSLLFFNACDVCIGLFWCDQSSTPKFTRKIKTPTQHKKPASRLAASSWRRPTLPSASSCVSAPRPALPCPDWWLLLRALSVIGCADGERVVHQNMGFLLTGTTSVRSVSTKSRVRVFPWGMTPPSLRRKYYQLHASIKIRSWDAVSLMTSSTMIKPLSTYKWCGKIRTSFIYLWWLETLVRFTVVFSSA